ncbi:MAG: glycine cleavage system protein GcvH [Alphaproteobacteria bacterium]|nr:glycine cleavage system protein GcvH [Alphaproteobacteria bacterium]MDE2112613.1 glycine cleavage system protein GcvH [Alphaproteobacteria bacterium]MDE2494450.1 glycine cleavage system protein GcvH [Alphaproteobacteria bacterium]
MSETRYTDQHEWVRVEGDEGTVGITRYATEQLGDVVYVELPKVGKVLTKKAEAAVVESVKAASEVYAPVGGTVTAVNEELNADPAKVNAAPEEGGWFFKLKLAGKDELSDLMTADKYAEYVKGL